MAEEDCRREQTIIFVRDTYSSTWAAADTAVVHRDCRVVSEERIPGISTISVSERRDVITRWFTRVFEALPNAFNRGDLSIRCRSFTSFG